jgi:hypothetical protein
MRRVAAASACALAAACAASGAAAADDAAALLKAADHWRMPQDSMRIETQVQVFNRDGSLDKERRYTVFAQARHRSLVLMRSPAEAGQKVLMLDDDFWLVMPASQRPIRITPMQKLLGDAATGDVATLSWSGDYTGQVVGDEPCAAGAAGACTHLSLTARRPGVSYQRIELWLAQPRHEPVRAELYVQSDKLAKEARFELDAAHAVVDQMTLRDALSSHKETRVRYLARTARGVPEAWLNPMFLVQNPALE